MSFLILVGFWVVLIFFAWLWGRRKGFRARYLDDWVFDGDDPVLWRDERADVCIVPTLARSAIIRPLRLHRWRVVATRRCIVAATPELFTRKPRVMYALYIGSAPATADTGTTGGMMTTGYRAMVVLRNGITVHAAAKPSGSYVALAPDRSVPSSFACAEFRIYTEKAESFPTG